MKIFAPALYVVFNFLVVTGLRVPGVVRFSSRGTASAWHRSSFERSLLPSLPARAVAREELHATATIMKVESTPEPERYSSALATTAAAVSGAIAFGAGINQFMGADKALQYFAGYVVEMSLSVDNLFVFLLLFRFFKVRRGGFDSCMIRSMCVADFWGVGHLVAVFLALKVRGSGRSCT